MTKLGVCYYPEHWDESLWESDARRMADLGLTYVRIGEFAWSRIEPTEGKFAWDWLDRAVEVLGAAGLQVVMGTPSATPPRWVVDKYPDMLAVDADGRPRKFGSRRHYCFSHEGYRKEAARITAVMGKRYGQNDHVTAWQIDNEYGCHDTTISYSPMAASAFQDWLAQKYQSTDALNRAWGNVFWSMEVHDFTEIDLPNLTVTEANPAHLLDFRRFTSDQVVRWNKAMVDALRPHTDAPLIHNYMGRITDFDHYKMGADLDVAAWDSYPLGFLEDRIEMDEDFKARYAQQGHPDFQAFHHDLYRTIGKGRWWVMEQQPGPVNWAPFNPAPLDGMVRLWSLEAAAHGAEAVCYFRWRQAPFAQEQMHAGLLKTDDTPARAFVEAGDVATDLKALGALEQEQASVALIFDYESQWAWEIQPQGQGFDYFRLVFKSYKALRQLGLNVDILSPETRDFTGYKSVIVPGLFHLPPDLVTALQESEAHIVWGPRTGSKTSEFKIPTPLPPAIPGLEVAVSRVETLRLNNPRALKAGGEAHLWIEELDHNKMHVVEETVDGAPIAVSAGKETYLGAWLGLNTRRRFFKAELLKAGVKTREMPEGLRRRRVKGKEFLFNYGAEDVEFDGLNIPAATAIIRT
ncbi:MAG: beta-galactosidase [Pseudomonadota bacterium]